MSIPLVSEIMSDVRVYVGDTDTSVPEGQWATDAFQIGPFNAAYQELFQRLSLAGIDRVRRSCFYNLPAYTPLLAPATTGMSNIGQIEEVRERGTLTTKAITGALQNGTATDPYIDFTAISHGFTTGQTVQIAAVGGFTDDINDEWVIESTGNNTFRARGITATGTYTSGGVATRSTEQWSDPLQILDDNSTFPETAQSSLQMLTFDRYGAMRFPPCNAQRQLKITYLLSSSAPASGSVMMNDSRNFLAYRTAEICAQSGQSVTTQATLKSKAEYFLALLVGAGVKTGQTQRSRIQRPPYRARLSGARVAGWHR